MTFRYLSSEVTQLCISSLLLTIQFELLQLYYVTCVLDLTCDKFLKGVWFLSLFLHSLSHSISPHILINVHFKLYFKMKANSSLGVT